MTVPSIEELAGLLCEIGRDHGPDAAWTANNAEGFARALLDRLPATSAGAGPVGEAVNVPDDQHRFAVTSSNYARLYLLGCYTTLDAALLAQGGRPDLWEVFERVDARPVEEPGEVERLTRELEEARQTIQEDGETIAECATRAETAEAALAESEQNAQGLASDLAGTQVELAETRERLEKVEAALKPFARITELPNLGYVTHKMVLNARTALSTQESSAALAGDA